MKAAIIVPGKKTSLKVDDIKMPKISDSEILIKAVSVGIDAQDYEIYEGRKGEAEGRSKKLIIGHECVGQVIMVGGKVSGFKDGDIVVPTIRRPGECMNCQNGEADVCLKGDYKERGIKGLNGFMAEYFKEKPEYLIIVPRQLKDSALLIYDMSVVEKAYRTIFAVQSRMTWKPRRALVIGSFSTSILAAALLKQKGFETYVTYEESDELKKGLFSLIGVKHFKSDIKNLHDAAKKAGGSFDVVVDATGLKGNVMHASMLLAPNGVYCIAGPLDPSEKVQSCQKCLQQGIISNNSIIVSVESSSFTDYKTAIKDLKSLQKQWPDLLTKMITANYSISDVKKAIRSSKDNIKSAIIFN